MNKRPGQKDGESAIEYMRRAIEWCGYEDEWRLDQLPSADAVMDLFELWHAYGTDFWSGILECIGEGDSPAKARAFVRKYKLPKTWSDEINEAVRFQKQSQRDAT